MKKIYEFPGGVEPGHELPVCPPPEKWVYRTREEIPTLNDKCSVCGVRPICFLEHREEYILEVFDKCKACLFGWNR